MVANSEFLSFATGVGANVESQADWAADPDVTNGFVAGIARSPAVNKAWRQATFPNAVVTLWMSQVISQNVLDDGNLLSFWSQFWQAILGGGFFDDTGSASAIVVTAPAGLTFPVPFLGMRICVRMNATTTGATTLNWMGHTNNVIYGNAAAIASGDLVTDSMVDFEFDGTNWQVVSSQPAIIARFATSSILDHGILQMNKAPVRLLYVSATPGVHSFTPTDNNFFLGYATGSGGGGAGSGVAFTGGGGGAGGTAFGWTACTIGTPVSITVAAGGARGLANNDGSAGATTSIGATHTATGGAAGQSTANAAGGQGGYGALSGTGFILYGGYGGDGFPIADDFGAGTGGASYWGGGARGASTNPVTANAAPGSGGGGGYSGGGGSPGLDGMVIIWG